MDKNNIKLIGAFLVGFALSWVLFSDGKVENSALLNGGDDVDSEVMENKDDLASITNSVGDNDSIDVEDQAAGSSVIIKNATFENDTWIAIHEDRDGEPGNVLGAAWYPQRTNSQVKAELLRNTEAGKIYYAMLHEDVGNDHKFDINIDKPVLGKNGKPITAVFKTLTDASTIQ